MAGAFAMLPVNASLSSQHFQPHSEFAQHFSSAFVNWNTAAIIAAGISVWAVSHFSISLLDYSIHIYRTVTRYGVYITVV